MTNNERLNEIDLRLSQLRHTFNAFTDRIDLYRRTRSAYRVDRLEELGAEIHKLVDAISDLAEQKRT